MDNAAYLVPFFIGVYSLGRYAPLCAGWPRCARFADRYRLRCMAIQEPSRSPSS